MLPRQIETPGSHRRDMGVAVGSRPIAGLAYGHIMRTLVRAVLATPTLGPLTGCTEQLIGRNLRRIVDYRFSGNRERDTMIDLKVVSFVFCSANGAVPVLFIEQGVSDCSRYPGASSQLFRPCLFESSEAVSSDPPAGRTFYPEGLKRNPLLPDVSRCAGRVVVAIGGPEVVCRDEAMLQDVIDDGARTLARHPSEEFGQFRMHFFHTLYPPSGAARRSGSGESRSSWRRACTSRGRLHSRMKPSAACWSKSSPSP